MELLQPWQRLVREDSDWGAVAVEQVLRGDGCNSLCNSNLAGRVRTPLHAPLLDDLCSSELGEAGDVGNVRAQKRFKLRSHRCRVDIGVHQILERCRLASDRQ